MLLPSIVKVKMLIGLLDFERTFIQAIVYNYDVLREYGTEADVKAAGKVLTKGKDYEMVSLNIVKLAVDSLIQCRPTVIFC